MSKIFLILSISVFLIIILSCSSGRSIKSSDIAYSREGSNVQLNEIPNIWRSCIGKVGRASCVCIGNIGNQSVIVSADHVIRHNPEFVIFGDGKYKIKDVRCHDTKDICVFYIDGLVPYLNPIDNDEPDDTDITLGFVNGFMVSRTGVAIPGQSGGGVFAKNKGLYAIVSTTGTGVKIIPALMELGVIWREK